jgi:hypothetical protein
MNWKTALKIFPITVFFFLGGIGLIWLGVWQLQKCQSCQIQNPENPTCIQCKPSAFLVLSFGSVTTFASICACVSLAVYESIQR